MNDEVDALARAHADLDQSCSEVGSDEHGEVVEDEDADRVVVGVEDAVVGDAVLAGAGEDDRILTVNLS